MKAVAGLWIDHRRAVIAMVSDKGEETRVIESHAEKHPGTVASVPHDSQKVQVDDSHDREFMGHLRPYYDAVIAAIRDAEAILIFGPGEAKGELRKRLEKDKIDGRVIAVETVDRMTDRQVAAKVREYFKD